MPPDLRRTWWPVCGLLALTLFGFEATSWDLQFQDIFFNPETGAWLIPRREFWSRLIFYTGPKALIILGGVVLLAILLGPAKWRQRWQLNRRQLGVVLLTLAIVPLLVGLLKDVTGVYCPWDIRRYGGPAPYVKVFAIHPADDRPDYAGRGFPAGHASGGFALFALISLARTRRGRWCAFALAMGAGGVMGLYQTAKGAHYLSHTLVTMELAWLVYVGLAGWIDPPHRGRHPQSAEPASG